MTEALVLGGGGVGGIAWIPGVLAGLPDRGQDFTGADVLVVTSAGSSVAAQVGSGLALEELYARQVEPALQAAEIMAEMDLARVTRDITAALGSAAPVADMPRAIGKPAPDAWPVPEPERRAVI